MRPLQNLFSPQDFPSLLVGLASPDDAAVYRLNEEQAIISTVDFFPPVVDNPYDFGAIAAANALSDVYAMGGKPIFAINLAAYPDGLGLEFFTEILRGGAEKVREAGAVIAGGHTVTDKEPKYGLAVTGTVHPQRIITKGGAKIGDSLILTKALGTGVITTALKRDQADPIHVAAAVSSMSRLSVTASKLAQEFGVRSMTDITGYSLIGHSHEMAHLGHVGFTIYYGTLRWLPGADAYARADIFPGGKDRNQQYFQQWTRFDKAIEPYQQDLLFDPQTSGGLLMAAPADRAQKLLDALLDSGEDAAIIGEVTAGDGIITIQP